jgi:hypothetical protein
MKYFELSPTRTAVFFRNAGRSVEQLQDRLACFVELIGIVTRRSLPSRRDAVGDQ